MSEDKNTVSQARTLISISTSCFNEEDNVEPLREQIDAVFAKLPQYTYELIFIDNHSSDRTVEKIKAMAATDKRIKLIVNARNFGHIRSPFHALLQGNGAAHINLTSDLQDPPELIRDFLAKWEEGHRIVVAVKKESRESPTMWFIRRFYYWLLYKIADIRVIQNFTGFGLYDRRVVEIIRGLDDPYPYFRGIIAEIGFEPVEIPYVQAPRLRGITKNNFYTLYDMAMLGITNHSKVPLRVATMGGFFLAFVSLMISMAYLSLKLVFWSTFSMGMAPVVIGVFFFASIQLFFIGLLGEYVAAIHTHVMKRPHVIEQERVNFDD